MFSWNVLEKNLQRNEIKNQKRGKYEIQERGNRTQNKRKGIFSCKGKTQKNSLPQTWRTTSAIQSK